MPNPRYRLYIPFRSYFKFFIDLILNRIQKGPDVCKLEQKLSGYVNISNVICVSQARFGIYLLIKNLIIPGQKVLMSPYTIADVVNMVVCAGGIPLFADITKQTCNISIEGIKKKIDSEKNIGAVLVTHLHGIAAPIDKIQDICREYNIPLIEDAAQAFGGTYNNHKLGTIADFGIYSFGSYKNITSWYGGAIVSNNHEIIKNIRDELEQYEFQKTTWLLKKVISTLLINIATTPIVFKLFTFWIFRFGFLKNIRFINKKVEIELNLKKLEIIPPHYLAKITPFQARMALSQLAQINNHTLIRRTFAKQYFEGLTGFKQLTIPKVEENNGDIYTYLPIQYKDRHTLLQWMMYHCRDIGAQHLKNCADLPDFEDYYQDCPIARSVAEEVILLPTYPRYQSSEVQKNIDTIKYFFKTNK